MKINLYVIQGILTHKMKLIVLGIAFALFLSSCQLSAENENADEHTELVERIEKLESENEELRGRVSDLESSASDMEYELSDLKNQISDIEVGANIW